MHVDISLWAELAFGWCGHPASSHSPQSGPQQSVCYCWSITGLELVTLLKRMWNADDAAIVTTNQLSVVLSSCILVSLSSEFEAANLCYLLLNSGNSVCRHNQHHPARTDTGHPLHCLSGASVRCRRWEDNVWKRKDKYDIELTYTAIETISFLSDMSLQMHYII